MARKLCKIKFNTNMFGTQTLLCEQEQVTPLNHTDGTDWSKQRKTLKENFFWLRSPHATVEHLRAAVHILENVSHHVEFKVWCSDGKYDASLKFSDADDAAMAAWSLNGAWCKWDADQESQWILSQKPQKPLRVKVDSKGRIRVKGKVQVSQYDPPDEP
jgi:DUF971 family protein